MPGGGAVLDTPGVRAVGLLDAAAGLDRAFADIDGAGRAGAGSPTAGTTAEPGCAVRAALESGELTAAPLGELAEAQREVAYESRRRDRAAGGAGAGAAGGAIHRDTRSAPGREVGGGRAHQRVAGPLCDRAAVARVAGWRGDGVATRGRVAEAAALTRMRAAVRPYRNLTNVTGVRGPWPTD